MGEGGLGSGTVSGSSRRPPSELDLIRWSESLAAIAQTGLGFTESLYEKERFEEIMSVAADIRAHAEHDFDHQRTVQDWLDRVGSGVGGYVTPKVTVGAVVGNDAGEILLIQRSDSGVWLYPTGWADVGYSPAEVVVKEVAEETGIDCEVIRPIAILDGMRRAYSRIPLYTLVFHCRAIGGELRPHPLETLDVGFFAEDDLPQPIAGAEVWAEQAFAAIRGDAIEVLFDHPRPSPWKPDFLVPPPLESE